MAAAACVCGRARARERWAARRTAAGGAASISEVASAALRWHVRVCVRTARQLATFRRVPSLPAPRCC
jgi:hypothetical protein